MTIQRTIVIIEGEAPDNQEEPEDDFGDSKPLDEAINEDNAE